ncbi:hypothetical protein K431DRAFT_343261 [Polychaeton citri CBS 116435]|uniref:RBR-type E3 ubiquitin transferase n=1 Tax=Polychaeton citri CBS 116435 TaxID=1314669 RepID=A0A9P4USR0_9PEZI|nr:hypothetical protein K431DRAFT_343261 [Polychaeton citri CBS 116435]
MAPSTKRRRTSGIKYLCLTCDTERVSSQFPDYNPTNDCDHLINTCTPCLRQWITAQLSSSSFKKIKCPECNQTMSNEEIRVATSKKNWIKYDERERRHILDFTPNWRWCLKADCRAGQVHESKPVPDAIATVNTRGKRNKKDQQVAFSDICVCHECGYEACVPCDRPWHAGESCAEYQVRIEGHAGEEDESVKAIAKTTKRCPRCARNIEKNGGCHNMHCTQCNATFCWRCASAFGDGSGPWGCKCVKQLTNTH